MKPRFQLPEAAVLGRQRMADGASVRTLLLPHPGPVANLLVLTGRADFLEKWADVYCELHRLGFAIASFDWRGQGGSDRPLASRAGHIDSYDSWLADLDRLASWAAGALPGVWFALGHSMGGHLLARWLADPQRHGRHAALRLRGAILASPFFDLGWPAPVEWLALRLAAFRTRHGHGTDYAFGQGPFVVREYGSRRQRLLTADRARFEDEGRWVRACPELATGGITWGWLDAYARSEQAFSRLPLEQLAMPVLFLLAGQDRVVGNRASLAVAARMPHARARLVPGSAHELLREVAAVRREALAGIGAFAGELSG